MELLKNIRYYKYYSLFVLIILVSFLTTSCLIPIYIDNQQSQVINSAITSVPYDESYSISDTLFTKADSPTFLDNSSLISNHFEYSYFSTYNTKIDTELNLTKRYDRPDQFSYVFMSFSNNTINHYLDTLGLPTFSQPSNIVIIIDEDFGSIFYLTVNVSIFFFILEPDPALESQQTNGVNIFEISSTPVKAKIGAIIPHTTNYGGAMFISNYQTFTNFSSNLSDQYQSNFVYNKLFVTFNHTLIDDSSINNAINSVNELSLSFKARLGDNTINSQGYNIFFDNEFNYQVLYSELTAVENQFYAEQVFFILFQIPSIIISFFLLNFMIKFWTRLKKEEYITLFKSGLSIKDIQQNIKHEFRSFVLISIFITFILVFVISNIFYYDVANNILLILLQLLFNFILILIIFQLIKVEIGDQNKFFNNQKEKDPLNKDFYTKLRKSRFFSLIFIIGIFFLGSMLINLLGFFGFSTDLITNIKNFLLPFNILLIIFTPIIGLFSISIALFEITRKLVNLGKKKAGRRYSSLVIQDLSRNLFEIFQIFLMFTIVFTIIIGPILGYSLINSYDQQQLSEYYGGHYSTQYYTGTYNLTDLVQSLNVIPDSTWFLVLKTDGTINSLPNYASSYFSNTQDIYFITGNYLGVIDNSLLPANVKPDSFNNSVNRNTYYTFLESQGLQTSNYELPQILDINYIYNNSQQTFSAFLPDQNEISYLPGIYTGENGYQLPFQQSPSKVITNSKLIIFAKLPSTIQTITPDFQLNFIFNFKGSNANVNQALAEKVLNHKIYLNFDKSTNEYVYNTQTGIVTDQLTEILLNIVRLSLIGSNILISMMLVVFSNNYIFERTREIGIFLSRGMSRLNAFKLVIIQLIIICGFAIIWGFLNSIAFSILIFNYGYQQQVVLLSFTICQNILIIIAEIIMISFIILIISSIKILRYNLFKLLKRSL